MPPPCCLGQRTSKQGAPAKKRRHVKNCFSLNMLVVVVVMVLLLIVVGGLGHTFALALCNQHFKRCVFLSGLHIHLFSLQQWARSHPAKATTFAFMKIWLEKMAYLGPCLNTVTLFIKVRLKKMKESFFAHCGMVLATPKEYLWIHQNTAKGCVVLELLHQDFLIRKGLAHAEAPTIPIAGQAALEQLAKSGRQRTASSFNQFHLS